MRNDSSKTNRHTWNRRSDEFLKEIAEEYRQACKAPGKFKPNQRIADARGVPLSRVEWWVRCAREREFLDPHARTLCSRCGQSLERMPTTIAHHHRASMNRMRINAKALIERCERLAFDADAVGDVLKAETFRAAADDYRKIVQRFEKFS